MYIYTIYMLNIYNIYKSKINYRYICKIKVVLKFVLKLFLYIYMGNKKLYNNFLGNYVQ